MEVPVPDLDFIATQCVELVGEEFDRTLDWQLDSLVVLDEICSTLVSDGPLDGDRLNLWWKLVGAYTGAVMLRAYGGRWVAHDQADGAFAIEIEGVTGFPFGVAARILRAEPYKSLASFGRSIPAIIANQQKG
jgi:hypothetical protein